MNAVFEALMWFLPLWSFVQDYHMWLVEIRQMSILIDILDSFYLSRSDGLLIIYLLGALLNSFSLNQNKNIIMCPLFTYL